jgi:F-type H+-transporting ATPase subunit b
MENPGLVSPNLVTFFFTFVNIGILFFILRAILFKPVSKFMANRAQKIQESIDQAAREQEQAKLLLAQYEEKLKNAGAEAEAIIKAARENAEAEVEQIVAEGKAGAQTLVENARKQIEAERGAALVKFGAEAAALVMAASSRLLAREVGGEDNRRYAAMLLEELAARRKGNS